MVYRANGERRDWNLGMRTSIALTANWRFAKPGEQEITVDLPHTWNNIDGQDGGSDYWRGTCVYQKAFPKPQFGADQRVYLEFRGVNASARVELNGRTVGAHDGGYSAFRWDVTDLIGDENALTVHVDNSRNDRVYPQKADFTFYGGIYRDVLLIVVNKDHFDMDYYGGSGLKITPTVDDKDGRVRVETFHNAEGAQVNVRLLDADGKLVAEGEGTDVTLVIPGVHLWDGVKDPYLYTCEAALVVDGKETDRVSAGSAYELSRWSRIRASSSTGGPIPSTASAATRTGRVSAARSPVSTMTPTWP